MKKGKFYIQFKDRVELKEGYIEDGVGYDKRGKKWYATDINSGMICSPKQTKTLKEAKEEYLKNVDKVVEYKLTDAYKMMCEKLSEKIDLLR